MTKSWQYRQTQDKLRIFVSSRLQECRDERLVVKKAIHSLNHNPVLFEHMGAKSYSPRDLYLSRLKDSQMMVAIYRSGYGYIDTVNGMEISGLEDEYRFSKDENIETIFYVWYSEKGRDPELKLLIDEITPEVTISYYEKPDQLYDRVKDDVTSAITDKYIEASSACDSVISEDPDIVLKHAVNVSSDFILRNDLIGSLIEEVKKTPILCMYGVAGVGKTILSAQIAKQLNARYVRVSGLSPKEIFSVCANILKDDSEAEMTSYLTLEGARLSLASAWAETSCGTLIVDECDYILELLDALSVGGGVSTSKNFVYTSRESSVDHQNYEIPYLAKKEVKKFIADNPSYSMRDEISDSPAVTPLLLKTQLMMKGVSDFSAMVNEKGTASEIFKYLALSPIPLTEKQLIKLRSDENYSIETLKFDIEKLGAIVDSSPRGYRLIHSEISDAISREMQKTPKSYRFFLNQLVLLMEDLKKYRYAYELSADLGGDAKNKYLIRAIREAVQLGDWRVATSISDQLISEVIDTESKSEAFFIMLSIVHPLELMGDSDRAKTIFERAKIMASDLGETEQLALEEVELSLRVRRAMFVSDVEELKRVYDRYLDQGKTWDQARMGLELSVIYLAAKNYDAAEEILRITLGIFVDLGDGYGIDLAQRNLASTLLDITGKEEEAAELISVISERSDDEEDNRRQRAWLCNVSVRRLRSANQYEEAEIMAIEAIEIANELGDESLRAINLVNLGNVYRDDKQPLKAIDAYNEAALSGKKCGRNDIEADASRLTAGIYNDFEETGKTKQERAELAKFFAQHAVGLVRNTINYSSLANASWELSEALENLDEIEEAAQAMFDTATALQVLSKQEKFSYALNYAIELSLPNYIDTYLRGIVNSLELSQVTEKRSLSEQFLNLAVPIMERAPKGALIHLLGYHLNMVWSKLPIPIRKGVVSVVVDDFHDFAKRMKKQVKPWRVLYSAIVIASLLKDTKPPYQHHALAASITASVDDVFVREEGDGSRVWTLILNLGRRVTVTISGLDATPASNLAMFSLAMFIKAFEDELFDLIGGDVTIDELMIHIASFSEMPEDLRILIQEISSGGEAIESCQCTVTRPTGFNESSPTVVILGSSFLEGVSFGEQGGNSLPLLFGLTLVEIAHQLLRGEVEMDTLRPKVVSLVHKARP